MSLTEEAYNGFAKPGQADDGQREEGESEVPVSPLPDDNVHALAADADGNIWAGTEQGITFFSRADETWSMPLAA
ncbi:MAG: two-component regulator propeller domain-containing protein [Caldilineaceae bacterium]